MTTAFERLNTGYYNSASKTGGNPGGFGDGGHVLNFPLSLADVAAVAAQMVLGTISGSGLASGGGTFGSNPSIHVAPATAGDIIYKVPGRAVPADVLGLILESIDLRFFDVRDTVFEGGGGLSVTGSIVDGKVRVVLLPATPGDIQYGVAGRVVMADQAKAFLDTKLNITSKATPAQAIAGLAGVWIDGYALKVAMNNFAVNMAALEDPAASALATLIEERVELSDPRIVHAPRTPYQYDILAGTPGHDDTAALQACLNAGGRVDFTGTWRVTKLVYNNPNQTEILGAAYIIAISGAAQTCIFEINSSTITFTGRVKVTGVWQSNYAAGFWVWHQTQLQYLDLDKISVDACQKAYRIGNIAYPEAAISEITIRGGSTYGCPVVVWAEGSETYVSVSSPLAFSADDFGGDAAWQAIPKRVLVAVGATIVVNGGEIIQTGDGDTDQYIIEGRPIVGLHEGTPTLCQARVTIFGSMMETAGPIALFHNPDGVTGTTIDGRRGGLILNGVNGYHGLDEAPMIETDASFVGDIKISNMGMWTGNARTEPNVLCGSSNTHVYCDDGSLGNNFKTALAGVSGGVVHFSRRMILSVTGLPATVVGAGYNRLKYATVATDGDRARFSGSYSTSTGKFVVPAGGLKDVEIRAALDIPGSVGTLVIWRGGSAVASFDMGNRGVTSAYIASINAGEELFVDFAFYTGNVAPSASTVLNTLTIIARA